MTDTTKLTRQLLWGCASATALVASWPAMAGAFTVALPSALLPWHAVHDAKSLSPVAASEAPLQINSSEPIHAGAAVIFTKALSTKCRRI